MLVEKDGMVELYTRNLGRREILVRCILLSERIGETHYLCSETATKMAMGERSKETMWGAGESE